MHKAGRFAFIAIDLLVAAAALANVVFPAIAPLQLIPNSALFGMIAYGLVLISVNLHRIADRVLKRALTVFFVVSVVFFPFLFIDSIAGLAPWLSFFSIVEGLMLPLYFLLLNILALAFGLAYLNRPPYWENNLLTPFFLSRFGITSREKVVAEQILHGLSLKEISRKQSLACKTVENHVRNVYHKTGVDSRIQLYRLVRSNAANPRFQ